MGMQAVTLYKLLAGFIKAQLNPQCKPAENIPDVMKQKIFNALQFLFFLMPE